mmetsp:Transcript_63684/g.127945  ORF Transcript_63684/g.127945 Transcript_63684/m.127945 type:complete len:201 (-) Transcript_63684:50-652(-)
MDTNPSLNSSEAVKPSGKDLSSCHTCGDTITCPDTAWCSAWKAWINGFPTARYSMRLWVPPMWITDTIPTPIPIFTESCTLSSMVAWSSFCWMYTAHWVARWRRISMDASSFGHSTIMASPANLRISPPPELTILTIIWKYLLMARATPSAPLPDRAIYSDNFVNPLISQNMTTVSNAFRNGTSCCASSCISCSMMIPGT